MKSLNETMFEYRKQLEKGVIQEAYQELMKYIMSLRTYFMRKYPDYSVSGSINYGFMDMTYFAFTPKSLKDRRLKIAIVFVYDSFRFEVWLSGFNKQFQSKYWRLFKESGWDKYHLLPTIKGVDSIVEYVVVENPDFSNPVGLTGQLENKTLKFIQDIEAFLTNNKSP